MAHESPLLAYMNDSSGSEIGLIQNAAFALGWRLTEVRMDGDGELTAKFARTMRGWEHIGPDRVVVLKHATIRLALASARPADVLSAYLPAAPEITTRDTD